MLSRLNQGLLILVLRLKLFLASNMADVADDHKLAVHVAKLSRFDANLKQDIVRIHGCRLAFCPRYFATVIL